MDVINERRQQFLEEMARNFLGNNGGLEVRKVFLSRFAYENKLKSNKEIAKAVEKEDDNLSKCLNKIYKAFNKKYGGPLEDGERGRGSQAQDLGDWLWGEQFDNWLKQQGIVVRPNPEVEPYPTVAILEPPTERKGQLKLKLQVTSNGPVIIEKKVKLVLDIDQLSPQQKQAILELLKQLTGDKSLDILGEEKGSVVLVLGGSEEGLERLEYLFKSGQLTELLAIPVKDVRDATAESPGAAPSQDLVNLSSPSTVQITIILKDPDLDDEELEEVTQKLYRQMRELEELEQVERVLDPIPPARRKASDGYLPGILKAKAEASKIKTVSEVAYERRSGKLKIKIEGNGTKEVTVDASNCSQQEFSAAVRDAAQQVLASDSEV